jgi:hypothetical protein
MASSKSLRSAFFRGLPFESFFSGSKSSEELSEDDEDLLRFDDFNPILKVSCLFSTRAFSAFPPSPLSCKNIRLTLDFGPAKRFRSLETTFPANWFSVSGFRAGLCFDKP